VISEFNPGREANLKIRITPNSKSAIVAMLFFAAIIKMRADTITVTNINDSGPGSLRQALVDGNDGDTITFAVTGTIGLTSGELLVDKNITISGPGATSLTVNGNHISRVLHIASGRIVTISGLGITNGNSITDSGGGIYNDHASLALDGCAISDNSAGDGLGGGIYNYGIGGNAGLQITNSSVTNNSASQGGAIFNNGSDSGDATVNVTSSTLSANSATYAGAIFNYGEAGSVTAILGNSTVSGNSVQAYGGAIYNDGQSGGTALLEVNDSTFSNNSAGAFGGGIFNIGGQGADAVISIGNTIFRAGAAGENIVNSMGTVTSLGYNIGSDDGGGFLNGPGDQINTDPLLGPLQGNGGPTSTHELLPGSPAIDAGDPNFTPPPFYDQRGPDFFRVRNGRVDIGSFEVQVGSTPTPRPIPTPRPRPASRPRPTPH
jgi:hypothetical protein